MGCGCGKNNSVKNVSRNSYRPIISPSKSKSSPAPIVSPGSSMITAQQESGLDSKTRENAKKRRDALLKKLGRL